MTTKASFSNRTLRPGITITHPHTYAEESLKGPVVVETIAQAFESARFQQLSDPRRSISLSSIPDLVLWAGREASRTREVARISSKNVSVNSEDIDTLVGASISTPTVASTPTIATPNTAVSDCFKALPDIPRDVEASSSIHSYRPLSIQVPVKRSYSFSLSSACRSSFVSSRPSAKRGKTTVKSGKSLLRRFVLVWKRVTNSNRIKRKRRLGRGSDGKRASLRLPRGFELVDPKHSSWWRRNSTSKGKKSGPECQSKPPIDTRGV